MFDLQEYGASGFPGPITGKFTLQYCLVVVFRVAEVGSRLLTINFFHLVTRPFGGFVFMGLDFLATLLLTLRHDGRNKGLLKYTVPSCFCNVNPMLEQNNVLSIPHVEYYAFRLAELVFACAFAVWFRPENIKLILTVWPLNLLAACWIASTIIWVCALAVLRWLCVATMQEDAYQWSADSFTEIQMRVRNDMVVQEDKDLFNLWLSKLQEKLKDAMKALNDAGDPTTDKRKRRLSISRTLDEMPLTANQEEEESFADRAEMIVAELLILAYNTPMIRPTDLNHPDGEAWEGGRLKSMSLASELLAEGKNLQTFESLAFDHVFSDEGKEADLESVLWAVVYEVIKRAPAVSNTIASHKLGP